MKQYRPPYEVFAAAYNDIRQALLTLVKDKRYEDAVIVPAVLSVAANLSVLSDSTDAEIMSEFKNALFDARTRKLEENPQ